MKFTYLRLIYPLTCVGATLLLFPFPPLEAGGNEPASLSAQVAPGPLAIVPASVAQVFTPRTGTAVATSEIQTDAIFFRLSKITVEDLNGDGIGFRLTATPTNLVREGFTGGTANQIRRNTLEVGTVTGFVNSSDPANTVIPTPNLLQYTSGAGVVLEIDYEIYYTIPINARNGDFVGSVALAVVAE